MSRELALQVRDLNVWYRPGGVIRRSRLVPVLHDISFDLWRGEALGLVTEKLNQNNVYYMNPAFPGR